MPFSGVYPIVPTPFDDAGNVDRKGFESVVRYALEAGVDGLVYPANASEFFTLSLDERRMLVEQLLGAVDGRVPVIVSVTSENAETSRSLAAHAHGLGAAGLLLLLTSAHADDTDAAGRHVRQVAEASGLPLVVQNAPPPLGAGLSVDEVVQLARSIPQVRYLKEEIAPTAQRIGRAMELAGSDIDGVFGGDGGRSLINELIRGACGTMPAIELAEVFVRILRQHRSGEVAGVYDSYQALLPLLNIQRVYKWAFTKRVLMRRGIIACEHVRAGGSHALDGFDEEEVRGWYRRIRPFLLEAYAKYSDGE